MEKINLEDLSSEQVTKLAKLARKIYSKKWRDKNPNRVKGYQQSHYLKKALEMINSGEIDIAKFAVENENDTSADLN